jgi:TP901 family phage tail tape measure protein
MSVRTETLQLRVLVDGTPARRELATLDQEYAKLNSGLKDLKRNSKEWQDQMLKMDGIKGRQAELRKEIGDTALSAKQLTDELKRLQVVQRNATPNTEQWVANAARIEQLKQRLRELNDVNAQAASAWEIQRRSIKLTNMSMQQLEQESKRLKAAMHNINPNTAEFAQYRRELTQVERRQKDLQSGMSGFARSWQNIKSQVMGAVAVMGGFFAGSALMSGFRNLVQGAAALSDELANVRKATGLTAEEASRLDRELRKIDTRTAGSQLREIAVGLGQAGEEASVSAVAAIDKINVALGDEFGTSAKEITTTLSQLRNNLSDIKSGDYGNDVGRIGNALNVLGANGLATAPVVSDIASRVSGAARVFKIASGDILGTAATFQELGINTERGSTAYVRVLQKIASEPQKFARVVKAAGLDVDLFNKQVNDDMQAAFVTVAKAARIAGTSNTEFAGILAQMETEGIGVSELLSKIGANQEMLAEKSKLATDALTNQASITEEFNIKNNTFGAQLEKLGRAWDSFTARLVSGGGALSGFLSGAVQQLRYFVDGLRDAETFMDVFNVLSNPAGVAQLKAQQKGIEDLIGKSASYVGIQQTILALGKQRVQAEVDGDEAAIESIDKRITALRQQLLIRQAAASNAPEKAAAAEYARLMGEMTRATQARAVAESAGNKQLVAALDQQIAKLKERALAESAKAGAARGRRLSATPNPPPDVVEDLTGLLSEEEKNAVLAEMDKLRVEMEAARERIFQDGLSADERDLRQLDVKHKAERDAILANKLHTEADLRALDEAQERERANLIEAQGEERLKGYSEAAEKIRLATLSAGEKQLEDEMRKWDALIALAKKYGIDSTDLEEARLKALAVINDKADKDADKKFGERTKAAITKEREALQQRIALVQEFGSLAQSVASYMDAVSAAEEARADSDGVRTEAEKARIADLNEQRKQAALIAIAVQGAAAIANGVASAMAAPNWVVGVGQALATVGIVIGLMAQAKALMNQGLATPSPTTTSQGSGFSAPLGEKGGIFDGPSHAEDGLKVVNPKSGQIVAEVEGGEPWMVLSKLFRRNNPGLVQRLLRASATGERMNLAASGGVFAPVPAFNFTRATEAIQMAQGGLGSVGGAGYKFQKGNGGIRPNGTGGSTHYTFSKSTGLRTDDGDAGELLAMLKVIAQNTGAFPRQIKANVSLKQLREKETEQDYLTDRTTVKRLK